MTQPVDLDRHASLITVMDAVIPVLWEVCSGAPPGTKAHTGILNRAC